MKAIPGPAISLSPTTGVITIEGVDVTLAPGSQANKVRSVLSRFYRRAINHNNGYEWLSFGDLSFADRPCGMSVCFKQGSLTEIHWGVALPGATEANWPSREDIEKEVAFIRSVLSKLLSRSFASGLESFGWGQVWSVFDSKGFIASTGVRYVV